ncbi:MAG: hypothetical protein KJ606_11870 [Chloroflexi bacterium]|nr:hypothetical protein [Chloroflexota bacterium]
MGDHQDSNRTGVGMRLAVFPGLVRQLCLPVLATGQGVRCRQDRLRRTTRSANPPAPEFGARLQANWQDNVRAE